MAVGTAAVGHVVVMTQSFLKLKVMEAQTERNSATKTSPEGRPPLLEQ